MIRTVKRAGLVNHSCRQEKYVKIPRLGVITITIKLHSLTNLNVQENEFRLGALTYTSLIILELLNDLLGFVKKTPGLLN